MIASTIKTKQNKWIKQLLSVSESHCSWLKPRKKPFLCNFIACPECNLWGYTLSWLLWIIYSDLFSCFFPNFSFELSLTDPSIPILLRSAHIQSTYTNVKGKSTMVKFQQRFWWHFKWIWIFFSPFYCCHLHLLKEKKNVFSSGTLDRYGAHNKQTKR